MPRLNIDGESKFEQERYLHLLEKKEEAFDNYLANFDYKTII